MIRKITGFSLFATALLGILPLACKSGGVGDPCVPEDEYNVAFPGYQVGESNAETKSFQCETRLCLVDHFQGRVSCKYGQDDPGVAGAVTNCFAPDDTVNRKVTVKVDAQLKGRTADKAVYCSCRCDGKDKNARYCKCPSGFSCQDTIPETTIGAPELVGSYCIKDGATYDPKMDKTPCSPTGYPAVTGTPSCGEPDQG